MHFAFHVTGLRCNLLPWNMVSLCLVFRMCLANLPTFRNVRHPVCVLYDGLDSILEVRCSDEGLLIKMKPSSF